MNKKYTINNVEVTAEQIKDIIKNNPELLEDKEVNGRYFFPKMGEEYWFLDTIGDIHALTKKEDIYEKRYIELGVYRTKEDAELARDKRKAIVACWKWAEENAPFEPDWKNGDQKRYHTHYYHFTQEFYCGYSYDRQDDFTLPHFKTEKDCEKFIEANKANLELLFTK